MKWKVAKIVNSVLFTTTTRRGRLVLIVTDNMLRICTKSKPRIAQLSMVLQVYSSKVLNLINYPES
jgi:hypothetical protein